MYNGSVPLAFRCMLFPKENRYQNYIVSFFEQQSVTHHFNLMRRIGLHNVFTFAKLKLQILHLRDTDNAHNYNGISRVAES